METIPPGQGLAESDMSFGERRRVWRKRKKRSGSCVKSSTGTCQPIVQKPPGVSKAKTRVSDTPSV